MTKNHDTFTSKQRVKEKPVADLDNLSKNAIIEYV